MDRPSPNQHRSTLRPWTRVLLCCVAGWWWIGAVRAALPADFEEYQVKAAWMLNFTKFVEWPKEAFAAADSPCVVGVYGKDVFGPVIDTVFTNKTIKGRSFQIRRITRESDLAGCHLLFIPASERRNHRDIMTKLNKSPVLTVGESDSFHEHGGIMNFAMKGNSIQFEIDLRNAQKAGLRIDANLLKIASKVRGKYE